MKEINNFKKQKNNKIDRPLAMLREGEKKLKLLTYVMKKGISQ